MGVWNETDAAKRRTTISQLWTPEGEHFVRTLHAAGYAELEKWLRRPTVA